MAKQEIVPAIDATIQSRVKKDVDTGIGLVMWLASANDLIPPWWSKRRDIELRKFWKRVDYLSGAIYTLESRMTTIPFRVVPKDNSVEAHVRQAARFEENLNDASEFGKGWNAFFGKWIEDILTQDNGCFAEVIGPGDPDGPLMGAPFSIANLDSSRCIRTSNPEFPVIYQDKEGGKFKLHHTRVAFASLMTSPIEEMHGVGFSSVSRCINTAQHLLDILIYKQEKLGSRPHRGIMIAKGGLNPENIQSAFEIAGETMDNQRLSRYSKFALLGSSAAPDAAIDLVDLSTLPDGFDEQTSVTLGMATIALAFGVDARELFPAQGVGATKADALVQHLKSRGKGIGQLLEISEREIEQKFLPPYLQMIFDFQDDAQDKQVAEIKRIRSERHEIDLRTEMVDERTAREQMLADGDLTQAQFEELELRDGRLPDGSTALALFHSPEHEAMLELGVPDALNIEANDAETMKAVISDKRTEFIEALGVITNHRNRKIIKESMTALMVLLDEYEDAAGKEAIAAMQESVSEGDSDEETPNEDEGEVDDEEMDDKTMAIVKSPMQLAVSDLRQSLGVVSREIQESRKDIVIPAPVVNVNVDTKSFGQIVADGLRQMSKEVRQQKQVAPIVNITVPTPEVKVEAHIDIPAVVEETSLVDRDHQGLITRIRKRIKRA